MTYPLLGFQVNDGIYRNSLKTGGSTCKKRTKTEFMPKGCAVGSSHLHALSQALCWLRGELVPDHGALFQGQEQSSEPLGCPSEVSRVPAAALEGKAASHVDALIPNLPTSLFLNPEVSQESTAALDSRYPGAEPGLPSVPVLAKTVSLSLPFPCTAPLAALHCPGLRGLHITQNKDNSSCSYPTAAQEVEGEDVWVHSNVVTVELLGRGAGQSCVSNPDPSTGHPAPTSTPIH